MTLSDSSRREWELVIRQLKEDLLVGNISDSHPFKSGYCTISNRAIIDIDNYITQLIELNSIDRINNINMIEIDRLEKENYRLRIELATTKATLEVLYERLTRIVVDVKKKIAQAQAANDNG